jgi:steroid 5-alpha reductase family enzyme
MIGTPQAPTEAIDFWLPVVVVFAANTLVFIFCSIVKDNSWIDAYWGISFVLPIAAVWIARASRNEFSV